MTENLKQFLEAVSRDKEFIEKLNGAETPEAVIAMAAEKGFSLTAEDLREESAAAGLSDDELNAVAGGVQAGSLAKGGRGEFASLAVDQLRRQIREAEAQAQKEEQEKRGQILGMKSVYGHEYL